MIYKHLKSSLGLMKRYHFRHQSNVKVFSVLWSWWISGSQQICMFCPLNSSNQSQFRTVISRMLLLCKKRYTLAGPKLKACYCISVLPNKLHSWLCSVCLSVNKDANMDVPSYQLLFCRTRKQLIIPEASALFWIW